MSSVGERKNPTRATMPEPICSRASAPTVNISSEAGCPGAALLCGLNISGFLENATQRDVEDMCLSEEEYMSMALGPPRSPVFLPVCVAYLTIFAVGVLGNSLTCAVILRYKAMRTPTNYYLLSLAASDLLLLLLGMPLELYEMWRNYPFLLGAGGCYFKTFLFETVCFASVLNVTALSAERYVAVVHPLKVKHVTTSAHVKRVVSALWSLSMLCSVPNASLHGITVLPPRFGRHFPRSAICRKYGTGGGRRAPVLAPGFSGTRARETCSKKPPGVQVSFVESPDRMREGRGNPIGA